jgi:NAD-dependent deacetylase
VDDLHERAGSKRVLHMHGTLNQLRCEKNENHVFDFLGNEDETTRCPLCGSATRPHIVWFGEIPLYMDTIEKALNHCENFVYIGTSSVVYPAAGFKRIAHTHGAHVTCLNLEIDTNDSFTDTFVEGKAATVVPAWCEKFNLV